MHFPAEIFYGFICLKPPLEFANASGFCLKATLENSSCVLPSSVKSRTKEFHVVLIVTAKICTKMRRDLPYMLFCLSNLSPVTPYNCFPTEGGVDYVHHTCVCCFFQDTTEDYGDNKPSLVDFRGDEFEERMLRKQRQAPPPPSTILQPTPAPRRLSSAARPVSL